MSPHLIGSMCNRLTTLLVALLCMGSVFPFWRDSAHASIDDLLRQSHTTLLDKHGFTESAPVIEQLYRQHNYQPLWMTPNGPSSKGLLIISALTDSHQEGLIPQDYLVDEIHRLRFSPLLSDQAKLDLFITTGFTRYLKDSLSGRINPCLPIHRLYPYGNKSPIDLMNLLQEVLTTSDLPGFLADLHPQHEQYRLLRRALAHYRQLALTENWKQVPYGPSIRPDTVDERLPLIIKRLQLSGDLAFSTKRTILYSGEIINGVIRFQERFSLEQDGIIGKKTLSALNTPVLDLINRIIINMERLRRPPRTFSEKRIIVNIPGFNLTAFEHGRPAVSMPVIVGQVYNKTPVFNDEMRFLVFNPYWNIPASIAENEVIPQQLENPSYLEENRIKLFEGWEENSPPIDPDTIDWETVARNFNRYRLRQDPGEGNPLGRVKFIFPNEHHVYLHDTPTKNLFKRHRRAFSHGCIRVGNPLALADFLLKDNTPSWDLETIEQHINSGVRKIVPLDSSVPIHILYKTVHIDPVTNGIFFYPDIYGWDASLLSNLISPMDEMLCLHRPR